MSEQVNKSLKIHHFAIARGLKLFSENTCLTFPGEKRKMKISMVSFLLEKPVVLESKGVWYMKPLHGLLHCTTMLLFLTSPANKQLS